MKHICLNLFSFVVVFHICDQSLGEYVFLVLCCLFSSAVLHLFIFVNKQSTTTKWFLPITSSSMDFVCFLFVWVILQLAHLLRIPRFQDQAGFHCCLFFICIHSLSSSVHYSTINHPQLNDFTKKARTDISSFSAPDQPHAVLCCGFCSNDCRTTSDFSLMRVLSVQWYSSCPLLDQSIHHQQK